MKYLQILLILNFIYGMQKMFTVNKTLFFSIKKFFINVYNGIIFFNLKATKLNTRRIHVK
ncbi:hypothetical protein CRV06_13365 [Halarcobacter anaerophilus]|jgi:hypothetical protein|uniref:Uncharacterized protein n=1 Tax=Halarcobacter anaerophilus TaxID=877500 RepID=A0A4Q0XVG3_9BACT|nr:hypothetical protein AANAER_2906 [Halarcobacter anaerophilus]RXJ61570.1 hypothetical protein CRV06_13365 [Halarcobacter anaerophilus]